MPILLNIDASPRGEMSISRKLGERYVHHWRAAHPDGTVIERNLMTSGIPYMDIDWIGGVYAPPQVPRTPEMLRALALSDELIQELVGADQLLICTPMYNYSIPAVLKSWIDYIVRPGFTFALAPGWPGLLADRPVRILVATRDVHEPGGEDDQVTPVIRRALSFMGIQDIVSLLAGGSLGVNRGDVPVKDHVARFEQAIASMV
ncbi:MAG: FMN-dependent NADH-azoreductase [Janthinobacterium lividum]